MFGIFRGGEGGAGIKKNSCGREWSDYSFAAYRARANSASRFQIRRIIDVRFDAEAISDREDTRLADSALRNRDGGYTGCGYSPIARAKFASTTALVKKKMEESSTTARKAGATFESADFRDPGENWTVPVRHRIDSSMDLLVPSDRGGSVCTFVT